MQNMTKLDLRLETPDQGSAMLDLCSGMGNQR
jgi:hypothetical protein